jgi:hypothetical protein
MSAIFFSVVIRIDLLVRRCEGVRWGFKISS